MGILECSRSNGFGQWQGVSYSTITGFMEQIVGGQFNIILLSFVIYIYEM